MSRCIFCCNDITIGCLKRSALCWLNTLFINQIDGFSIIVCINTELKILIAILRFQPINQIL